MIKILKFVFVIENKIFPDIKEAYIFIHFRHLTLLCSGSKFAPPDTICPFMGIGNVTICYAIPKLFFIRSLSDLFIKKREEWRMFLNKNKRNASKIKKKIIYELNIKNVLNQKFYIIYIYIYNRKQNNYTNTYIYFLNTYMK